MIIKMSASIEKHSFFIETEIASSKMKKSSNEMGQARAVVRNC